MSARTARLRTLMLEILLNITSVIKSPKLPKKAITPIPVPKLHAFISLLYRHLSSSHPSDPIHPKTTIENT